jgi:hypothetical protein
VACGCVFIGCVMVRIIVGFLSFLSGYFIESHEHWRIPMVEGQS